MIIASSAVEIKKGGVKMKKTKAKVNSPKSEKSKRIKSAVIASVLIALCATAFIVFNQFSKEYTCQTKNAIAMGTVITAKTYGEINTASSNETIVSIINQLEDVISCNKSGTLISSLNETHSITSNEISDVLNTCNTLSADTDGAFDITIGNVSSLWGFGTEKQKLPKESEIKKALKTVDYKKLQVSGGKITSANRQKVDLGAVGKGYACDMVKAYLEKNSDVKGAVISVGGSILAYGKRNALSSKWRIAIKDPRDENSFLGTIKLKEGFVSTSGDYEKYFEKNGKRYHHILDARTGCPADSGLISVTIVSDSGLLSDALSTACFILGKEDGMALADKYGASAVFVDSEKNISTVGDIEFERYAK